MSRPSSVEEWAPLFTLFSGTSQPKFSDEQICDPHFALTQWSSGTWCKLCDAHIADESQAHMRRHAAELRAWRRRRAAAAGKRAKATLRAINRERSAA